MRGPLVVEVIDTSSVIRDEQKCVKSEEHRMVKSSHWNIVVILFFEDASSGDRATASVVHAQEIDADWDAFATPHCRTAPTIGDAGCHFVAEHVIDDEAVRYAPDIPAPRDVQFIAHRVWPQCYRVA